ncbi:hypothetical protein MMC30_004208 [Trapelia coarctata]|nr:hypothetical protein [Trapelia coarctata]
MADQVVSQVDIGTMSLRGLSAFAPLLAALSADNVTTTAMLQMQALGRCFLTSGPYAAKVPDYLRRWRLGVYMADSAGGQAASLLALCLFSVFSEENAAHILYDLSVKLLPRETVVASVSQLLGVGRILKYKLETFGFGNLQAQQVTRVHDAYQHLGKDMPSSFFDALSTEATSELLACLSQALREEKTLVRITGSSGMANILGLALLMFPRDTSVTIEDIVIYERSHKSILVEIGGGDNSQFHLETVLETSPYSLLSEASLREGKKPFIMSSFTWKNWLADFLQIKFLDLGLSCTPQNFSKEGLRVGVMGVFASWGNNLKLEYTIAASRFLERLQLGRGWM